MTLENLVPPLELCKKIPEGCFAESALVWLEDYDGLEYVEVREVCEYDNPKILAPAPTLQEIIEDLARKEFCPHLSVVVTEDGRFGTEIVTGLDGEKGIGTVETAMKMWLHKERETK